MGRETTAGGQPRRGWRDNAATAAFWAAKSDSATAASSHGRRRLIEQTTEIMFAVQDGVDFLEDVVVAAAVCRGRGGGAAAAGHLLLPLPVSTP